MPKFKTGQIVELIQSYPNLLGAVGGKQYKIIGTIPSFYFLDIPEGAMNIFGVGWWFGSSAIKEVIGEQLLFSFMNEDQHEV
ncbi:hypothetical protein LCGC14_2769210 [marine sediment metagenome]|uniref:Uncharacterized protein n=1 Tax=marine sediment metagenome TaxID=412755 RepID=A0A0F8ZIH0_9ZZZZ